MFFKSSLDNSANVCFQIVQVFDRFRGQQDVVAHSGYIVARISGSDHRSFECFFSPVPGACRVSGIRPALLGWMRSPNPALTPGLFTLRGKPRETGLRISKHGRANPGRSPSENYLPSLFGGKIGAVFLLAVHVDQRRDAVGGGVAAAEREGDAQGRTARA